MRTGVLQQLLVVLIGMEYRPELALKSQMEETVQCTAGMECNRMGGSYYIGVSIPNTNGF